MHPFTTAFLSQTAPGGPGGGLGQLLLPFAAMIAVFYFVMWRPQAKERKKHQEMLQKLQKGHDVLTQAGFYAKVVLVEDQSVLLDLGGGTKVKMVRSFITRNLTLEEEEKAKRMSKSEAKK